MYIKFPFQKYKWSGGPVRVKPKMVAYICKYRLFLRQAPGIGGERHGYLDTEALRHSRCWHMYGDELALLRPKAPSIDQNLQNFP